VIWTGFTYIINSIDYGYLFGILENSKRIFDEFVTVSFAYEKLEAD